MIFKKTNLMHSIHHQNTIVLWHDMFFSCSVTSNSLKSHGLSAPGSSFMNSSG